jgi:low temperature requirement protein LtrA
MRDGVYELAVYPVLAAFPVSSGSRILTRVSEQDTVEIGDDGTADDIADGPEVTEGSDDGGGGERRVTWAELFFDLVFVFAVTEISGLLRDRHSVGGLLQALIVFVPSYWVWVGTSVYANTHDVDRAQDRLGIAGLGLASLFMALAIPGVYHHLGVLFGASYLGARLVLSALVYVNGGATGPLLMPVVSSGPLLLIGGFLPPGWREAVWGAAALIDLSTPAIFRRQLMQVRFDPGHLTERFGLLLIIALGESIVAVGEPAAGHIDGPVIGAVTAGFVLATGMWWVYFVFAAAAVKFALETAQIKTDLLRRVLSYGHLSFVAAIIGVASAMGEVVHHPRDPLDYGWAGLLFGAGALFLCTFGYTRWQMFRKMSWTRVTAGVLVLALLPLAPLMPAAAALAMLAVVLVGLNTVEWLRVKRAGEL